MLSNFLGVLLLLVNPSCCIDILSTPLSNLDSEKDLRNIHEVSRDVYGQVIEPSLNNTTSGHKDISLVDGGHFPENQRNLSTNGEFHLIEMCWYNTATKQYETINVTSTNEFLYRDQGATPGKCSAKTYPINSKTYPALTTMSATSRNAVRPTCITQSDFSKGTLILSKTGSYMLCENINFCPSVYPPILRETLADAFNPIFPSAVYDRSSYALGFFAAISVVGSNIEINLNRYTIQQCAEHSLVQRFFAVIELGSQPFTKGQGPHDFVGNGTFISPRNVVIRGPGRIGRSSHHGIHGNDNKNIVIRNVTFSDFEVAAIHINNVDGLVIEDCLIDGNRKDVPVLNTFNAALNMRVYLKFLVGKGYSMTLRNRVVTAKVVYDRLRKMIDNVYNDVVSKGTIDKSLHPMEHQLFHNPFSVSEGSCYGILVYGHGPATNAFALEVPDSADDSSSNVAVRRNVIKNLECFTQDAPALVEFEKVIVDARGAVFQLFDVIRNRSMAINETDGSYIGNFLSDAQIMTAKAINDGTIKGGDPLLLPGVNTINSNIVRWAEGVPTGMIRKVNPSYTPHYRCNGDSMHHVSKGMVGIRVEETLGFVVENNLIDWMINRSPPPFRKCYDYHADADTENGKQPQAPNIRGISTAGFRPFTNGTQSKLSRNVVLNCYSKNANNIIGIDLQGDVKGVDIVLNVVDLHDQSVPSTGRGGKIYSALVVGQSADDAGKSSTIKISDNQFKQKEDLQYKKLHLRKLKTAPHQVDFKLMQKGSGGCQFFISN